MVRAVAAVVAFLLASAATAAATKISAAIPAGRVLGDFAIAPNGARVVYELETDTGFDVVALVSASLGGGAAATLLSLPITDVEHQRSIAAWAITPDSTAVVLLSDENGLLGVNDLFVVAIDGASPAVQLNVAPAPGDVAAFGVAADSARVVFETNDDRLFSVALGGGTPVALGSLTGAFPPRFRIAPDGSRVVSTADPGAGAQVFSVPVAGGAPTQLSDQSGVALPADAITPDGTRVVFFGAHGGELWTTPIASMAPVRLVGPTAISASDVQLTRDSRAAVFIAGTAPALALFRVPLDGSGAAQRLSGAAQQVSTTAFAVTPNGRRIVYRVASGDQFRLFAVTTDGGARVELTPPTLAGLGAYDGYQVDASSASVVYGAEQDAAGVVELYRVAIGGGAAVKLTRSPMPAAADLDVASVRISPNGAGVLYVADQDTDGVEELFTNGITGGTPQKLHSSLAPNGDVSTATGSAPAFTPDSTHVVYEADQDTDDVFELYVSDALLPPVVPMPTETVTATPPATPTSKASGTTATPAVTPIVLGTSTTTATPTPVATRTPAPEVCDDCIDNDFDGLVDRADAASCPPPANGGGAGLDGDAARAAVACQKALGSAGATLVARRMRTLGACLQGAFACVQHGADPRCLARAGKACDRAVAARAAAIAKLAKAVGTRCADPRLPSDALRAAAGLGFDAEATGCAAFGVPALDDATAMATCVAALETCRADTILGMEMPRARELLARTGRDPGTIAPCLPLDAASGAASGSPAALACAEAVAKRGAAYVSARLAAEQRCVDAGTACVQMKGNGCSAKAAETCGKLRHEIAAAATRLRATLARACAPAALLDTAGVGLSLRASECTALGASLDSVDTAASCIVAQHACRVDQMLVRQAPRAVELGAIAP